jgi:hypothetical protein
VGLLLGIAGQFTEECLDLFEHDLTYPATTSSFATARTPYAHWGKSRQSATCG